jgi:hypothetical protein
MAENNSAQYFLVAAGGTGMRCLQSFINLAAVGMFKGISKVHILLMDTDEENKDKRNAENLIKAYEKLFSSAKDAPGGAFFKCELVLYVFVPDYSKDTRRNFIILSQLERGNSDVNHKLANIFFEDSVQEFDLSHGYRAQTHLGSYLMYHAFLEEIRKSVQDSVYGVNSQLYKFIDAVSKANNTEARIFAFGSSFGGTGASSIPVIPRAISDCTNLISGGAIQTDNIYYGGVVLSSYFKFKAPSDEEKKKEKVIANSQFFNHNSASALNYYINDYTILKTYKRLYLLGWPSQYNVDIDLYKSETLKTSQDKKTITGGKAQENPAHILEIFSAAAAHHFFDQQFTSSNSLKDTHTTQFKYKSLMLGDGENAKMVVDADDIIFRMSKGANTTSSENLIPEHEELRKNLIAFYSIGALVHSEYKGNLMGLIDDLKLYNSTYEVNPEVLASFSFFLNYFTLIPKGEDGNDYMPGWLNQVYFTFDPKTDKDFLELPNKFFGLDPSKWSIAYPELSKKAPRNAFVTRFKKLHKNKGGDFGKLVDNLRETFYSFKLDSRVIFQEE